jgi:hypothetical protein
MFLGDLLAAAGLDRRRFSPHSLRRGGATWAARVGVGVASIRQIGDWRSDAVNAYLPVFHLSATASADFARRMAAVL